MTSTASGGEKAGGYGALLGWFRRRRVRRRIRGLPDSAGASRVTVRLYAQGENIGEEVKICAADGKRFTPRFDLVAEFRRPAFDPTSTLLIRVDALDEDLPSGRKARCLGYTLLNLFHAPGDNKAQPADEQSQRLLPQQGRLATSHI